MDWAGSSLRRRHTAPPERHPERTRHNLWPARTGAALAAWIAERAGARAASIEGCERLSGGAVRENWGLEVRLEGVAGRRDLVLRAGAFDASGSRRQAALRVLCASARMRLAENNPGYPTD